MDIFNPKHDKLDYEYSYNTIEGEFLNNLLNHNSDFDLDNLRRVALWKIDRVLNIPDATIDKIRNLVKDEELNYRDLKVKVVINELLQCQGIGLPMASTILKFLRPDVFPIIDVRAYRALYGKKIYQYQYNYDLYVDYTEKVYEISKMFDMKLSSVDEQLYRFDQEHNGKI